MNIMIYKTIEDMDFNCIYEAIYKLWYFIDIMDTILLSRHIIDISIMKQQTVLIFQLGSTIYGDYIMRL